MLLQLIARVEAAEADPEKACDLGEDVLNQHGVHVTATFTIGWLDDLLAGLAKREPTPEQREDLLKCLVATGADDFANEQTMYSVEAWLERRRLK
ncbi:MAG: hypothetical protein JOY71_23470 [Acetobacteraceae bacterium]|nr:hypothetical protein [Acetobacteraceae bacterium]MBV8525044.1 hypothetical protein [Acetobacteraceae bacterium]MBV8591777.1 hypothetical protein [Acetobacteraceae bacterium]